MADSGGRNGCQENAPLRASKKEKKGNIGHKQTVNNVDAVEELTLTYRAISVVSL